MSRLLLFAILADLSAPVLDWKFGFPPEIRWISHFLFLIIALRTFLFILQGKKRFPLVAIPIIVLSIVGSAVGLAFGQSWTGTMWGWWLMFKGPLVGFFAYYYPRWSPKFPQKLAQGCLYLLLLELGVQLVMYFSGTPIGDALGGTLGEYGTPHLALLELLIFCLFLGEWIVDGQAKRLFLMSCLMAVSAVLGQMKIVPVVALMLVLVAIALHLRSKSRAPRVLMRTLGVVLGTAFLSVGFFLIVPNDQRLDYRYLLKPENFVSYASLLNRGYAKDDVGRNIAIQYAWDRIAKMPMTFLLGEGLGARNESSSLGVVGTALADSDLGLFSGSSLTVIIGEMGAMGLTAFIVAWLTGLYVLSRRKRMSTGNRGEWIRTGLLLYTLLWPIWLWYGSAWVYPVSSALYWTLIGYAFSLQMPGNGRTSFMSKAGLRFRRLDKSHG